MKLAVPALSDVAMVDMLSPEGQMVRMAAWSAGSDVADRFIKLRAEVPDRSAWAAPRRGGARTGEQKLLDRLSDKQIDEITTKDEEREALVRDRFRSCLLSPSSPEGEWWAA